jgi:toxin ParE1/3/4
VNVRLTAQAEAELEAIGDHIAADDPARAIAFVDKLRAACLSLAEWPHRFPMVPRYRQHGIRQRLTGNYLIFYRIDAGGITVLHILHGARDYLPLLDAP